MSTVNVGNSTSNPVPVNVNAALPAGSNTLGNINIQANGTAISFGQAAMANSLPVVVASNQSNLPANIAQVNAQTVATAATGIMKVGLTDGSGNAITSTSSAIDVNIKSGGGSGFSVTDEAAWTAGTSAFVPAGGTFNDSAAALTSGQEGTLRSTNNRALHVNLRDASANQLLGSKTSANSIPVVIASDQGAVAIGVASGTALAADQTNTILKTSLYVKKSANADTVLTLGSATSANSVPVVIASDQGAVAVTLGSANSTMIGVTSPGGTSATAIAAAATNTIVKASAGRLCRVLVTTAGTAALTFYDNATGGATTGNILGYIPANAGAGSVYDFQFIASTGIQAPGGANTPAVTVGYI